MTSPTRTTITHIPALQHTTDQLEHNREDIELGWSILTHELRHAGWPTRTPEGDRRPTTEAPDPNAENRLDYADPTGDLATQLRQLHDDRQTLEDCRHAIETAIAHATKIAKRYRIAEIIDPETGRTLTPMPRCTIDQCTTHVEARNLKGGGRSYVGMIKIAGAWLAKRGSKPRCAAHRISDHRGKDNAA